MRLLIIPMLVIGFCLPGQIAMAQSNWDFKISADLDNQYSYYYFRDNLPITPKIDPMGTTLTTDFTMLLGTYQYELKLTGDSTRNVIDLNQATVSKEIGRIMLEIGNKDWSWGKGFSFTPTYPLEQNESYWGGQAMLTRPEYNLSIGAATGEAKKEDNSNFNTAWLKTDVFLETSDYAIVMSYLDQNKQSHQNLGGAFSIDMQNGIEFHSELNLCYPEADCSYLIGGQYIGSSETLLLEYYHGSNNFTIFFNDGDLKTFLKNNYLLNFQDHNDFIVINFNNAAAKSNHWQWEIREIANLTDHGEIRTATVKYTKDDRITPRFSVINYAGPKDSATGRIPFYLQISLGVTVKLY